MPVVCRRRRALPAAVALGRAAVPPFWRPALSEFAAQSRDHWPLCSPHWPVRLAALPLSLSLFRCPSRRDDCVKTPATPSTKRCIRFVPLAATAARGQQATHTDARSASSLSLLDRSPPPPPHTLNLARADSMRIAASGQARRPPACPTRTSWTRPTTVAPRCLFHNEDIGRVLTALQRPAGSRARRRQRATGEQVASGGRRRRRCCDW
jgi:hypothetical protein